MPRPLPCAKRRRRSASIRSAWIWSRRLDTYVTRTGFEVIPWVGLVMPPIALVPDPFEVAEVFEVPLGFFLDPLNRKTESRVWQGRSASSTSIPGSAITSGARPPAC